MKNNKYKKIVVFPLVFFLILTPYTLVFSDLVVARQALHSLCFSSALNFMTFFQNKQLL